MYFISSVKYSVLIPLVRSRALLEQMFTSFYLKPKIDVYDTAKSLVEIKQIKQSDIIINLLRKPKVFCVKSFNIGLLCEYT